MLRNKRRILLVLASIIVGAAVGAGAASAHVFNHPDGMESGWRFYSTTDVNPDSTHSQSSGWGSMSYEEEHWAGASSDFTYFAVDDTRYFDGSHSGTTRWLTDQFIWDDQGEHSVKYPFLWLCTQIDGLDSTRTNDWEYDGLDSYNDTVVSQQEVFRGESCAQTYFGTHSFRWEAP